MHGKPGPDVRLLIIDDDPQSLPRISEALAQPGLEILTAIDTRTGLDIASLCHPHIVLMTPQPDAPATLARIVAMDAATRVIRLEAHCPGDDDAESSQAETSLSLSALAERVARLSREIRRRRSRSGY